MKGERRLGLGGVEWDGSARPMKYWVPVSGEEGGGRGDGKEKEGGGGKRDGDREGGLGQDCWGWEALSPSRFSPMCSSLSPKTARVEQHRYPLSCEEEEEKREGQRVSKESAGGPARRGRNREGGAG